MSPSYKPARQGNTIGNPSDANSNTEVVTPCQPHYFGHIEKFRKKEESLNQLHSYLQKYLYHSKGGLLKNLRNSDTGSYCLNLAFHYTYIFQNRRVLPS